MSLLFVSDTERYPLGRTLGSLVRDFEEKEEEEAEGKMAAGYDDCYDASWHLIPPDYVSNEEDYR